jgi:hypothetical protein
VRARAEFAAPDTSFVRVIEDVRDVLKAKGLVADADLPQAAQDKLAARKSLRGKAAIVRGHWLCEDCRVRLNRAQRLGPAP